MHLKETENNVQLVAERHQKSTKNQTNLFAPLWRLVTHYYVKWSLQNTEGVR